jgi:hypothetical protein
MSNDHGSFDIDRYLGSGPNPQPPGPPPGPRASGMPYAGPAATRTITFSRPRTGWLAAAAGVALCGLLLAVTGLVTNLPTWTAFAAWALAAPAGIALFAVYRHLDTQEQARPGYALASSTRALAMAVPVVIVLGAVASSIGIAVWAGQP